MCLMCSSFRIFTTFYIITSVIVVAAALGNIGTIHHEIARDKQKREALRRDLDLDMIAALVKRSNLWTDPLFRIQMGTA